MPDRNPPPNYTGLWSYACPTGTRYETEYLDGVPHGVYRQILPNGVADREGQNVSGLEHGTTIVRNAEGVVLDRSEFTHGTGIHRIFTSAGRLGWEIPCVGGVRHGTVRRYLPSGRTKEEIWDRGTRVSGSCLPKEEELDSEEWR